MITLRPNQTTPIAKAIQFFREERPKPSLIVLPTAWGKSILTAYVAKNSRERLIVLQPSKELLEQNFRKYCDLCGGIGINAGIYSTSLRSKQICPITYATIGSIKNIGSTFRQLGFTQMIIDEAHLYPRTADSMLGTFLRDSGITHVLGITATPIKLQQNTDISGQHISKLVMLTSRSKYGNFFKEIIHVGQIKEMVDMGYWSHLTYKTRLFNSTSLRYNSSKSEFTEESVVQAYSDNNMRQSIDDALTSTPERKHILVFCPTVEEAIQMAEKHPHSAAIYGNMDSKLRNKTIEAFRAGQLRVLFNVRVLSTGFDYTGIDCIILGISTASIALYYQIIGRATRIHPGKDDALIIDFGGNVSRFGHVEDITYEQGKTMWRMFGTGGRLLSGVAVHEIGSLTKQDTEAADAGRLQTIFNMPFGKYKGLPLKDIPADYRRWMLRTFKWNETNKQLKMSILATL